MKLISKYVMTQMLMRGGGNSTRWVWTLNGMSYGAMPVAEFSGDLSIEISILSVALGGDSNNILGEEVLSQDTLQLDATPTTIRFECGGVLIPVAHTLIEGDVIHLTRVGSVASIGINGVYSSASGSAGLAKLAYLGYRPTLGRHWDGAFGYLRATGITNTDVYTSGTFNYKLDEPYSDSHIAVDSDNPDGVELWTAGDVVVDTLLTETLVSIGNVLTVGATYIVKYNNQLTAGSARFLFGSASVPLSAGYAEEIVIASTTTLLRLLSLSGGATGTISNISVKQTTAMQKFNDLPEDYSEVEV